MYPTDNIITGTLIRPSELLKPVVFLKPASSDTIKIGDTAKTLKIQHKRVMSAFRPPT